MVAVRLANGTWKGIRGPVILVLLLVLAFSFGIVAGSFFINGLSDNNKVLMGEKLASALDDFMNGTAPPPGEVFLRSAGFNLKTALVLWFLGLTVVGLPFVFLVLFLRGFIIGFSVGFLYYERGWDGLMFALAAILPSSLLAVPGLLLLGALAVAFSLHRRTLRRGAGTRAGDLIRYSGAVGILLLLLLAASAVEGYGSIPVARFLAPAP